MLILTRLSVWFAETVAEALFIGIVLALLLGHDQNALIKDVLIYSSAIGLLFFTTGYLLSTILVRTFWRGQTIWSYPAIATVLFLIHFEIMNLGVGGAFAPKDRLPIRMAGTCIAFFCTSLGTLVLRKSTLCAETSHDG